MQNEWTKLQVGMNAPDFRIPNQDGIEVGLRDLLSGILVLYFYPKDNTPGCTLEAREFTALLEKFSQAGASVVGVSPDSSKSHKNFICKQELGLMLLSDGTKEVARQYGAWGEKKLYGKVYEGIVRSTFVIGRDGKILSAHYGVKAKGHAEAVLKSLQGKERLA